MGFYTDSDGATAPNTAVLERIKGSGDVMAAISKSMKPGTVLVTPTLRPRPTRARPRTSW
jgi:hypothetical protein